MTNNAVISLDLRRRGQESDEAGRPSCVPTLSCGLSECAAGDTPPSLYERADGAQYIARRRGKNRVVVKDARLLRDLGRH